MNPIISFKNFSFKYRVQKRPTLKNINLDIYPGEKILICGPSGCGKSTMSSCINGLIPFSYKGEITGDLIVDGINTKESSIFDLSKHVGTVLQDSDAQFIGLTVAEDIAFSLENDCVPQNEMFKIVDKVANSLNLKSLLSYAPNELSGGQKQRVGLAGITVNDVPILLFDEPLANLDPSTGKQTIELIDEINKNDHKTIIIVEHRLEDVLYKHVDRIVLMNDGEIQTILSPNELLPLDYLSKVGVREPLYVTALKYAGLKLTKDNKLESIETLTLSNEDKKKVKDFYLSVKPKEKIINDQTILETKNLSFRYNEKKLVLDNINFKINTGEMISIVGQNGAGKSTFSKVICAFENGAKGDIYYLGNNINDLSIRERAKKIGYVMQNPNQMIVENMIYDELALGLRNNGYKEEEIKEKIEATLKTCGLYEYRNWPINALSYGQKKRVTIASILVMGPSVIILDEPTAGQDFKHYTDIMDFLKKINEEGITIIMITHDMHLMLEYTDRAIVFTNGKIIADTKSSIVLCDDELIEKSNLKKTSLFDLAKICDIEDPIKFIDSFIQVDKEVRNHES